MRTRTLNRHLIRVTGRGQFPFDMLRYDECFPYRVMDCSAMTMERQLRDVVLVCVRPHGPTVQRWRSFGWNCQAEENG